MARHAPFDADSDPKAAKLWSLIKDLDVAMMTTIDHGHLRARPMWTLKEEFRGTLYFFTRLSSAKMDEIEAHHEVCLAYADPKDQTYVSVSGIGRIDRDPARIRALWREPMRTWFPDGVDDPDLALLAIDVEAAEYWDAPSSAMVHLFGYAKARLTGEPPHPGDHQKLGGTGHD